MLLTSHGRCFQATKMLEFPTSCRFRKIYEPLITALKGWHREMSRRLVRPYSRCVSTELASHFLPSTSIPWMTIQGYLRPSLRVIRMFSRYCHGSRWWKNSDLSCLVVKGDLVPDSFETPLSHNLTDRSCASRPWYSQCGIFSSASITALKGWHVGNL
jgi:hypothetical protein